MGGLVVDAPDEFEGVSLDKLELFECCTILMVAMMERYEWYGIDDEMLIMMHLKSCH